ARAAAAAASRTAAAAARAQQAAAAARKAAADAATNEAAADQARQKAEEASRIALEARHKLVLFVAVRLAIDAGMYAVDQANAAAANAEAAATANDNAIQAANAAGAGASEAVAAANRARAAATQARRAAQAAERYLNVARQAADAAQDAANRAVANAEAAARAAIEAAEHAGEAAEAANRATEHAKAATEAAIAAVDAANQASTVYEAARRADAERLAVAKDQGIEASRAAKAQYDALEQAADWDVEEAAKRDTQTNQLLALAQNPATPQADAVKAGRTAALNLTKAQGPHTREAALAALAASDDEVLVFARTGVARANGLDDRAAVMRIAVTENAALATAAQAALEGTDAQVRQFLRTQEYPGRYAQDRIKVNQILSTARANGDTVTAQRAQAALDAGTLQALRDFLDTGRFDAEAVGERVRVNQILAAADSGPEVKAAAQVALDGPPSYLRDFLSTDRYVAAERDNEAAAHLANVGGLLEKIHEVATTATTNALQAQEVAAKARGDAEQAIEYAKQATESATRAGEYAEQAQAYADDAKRSVEKAAAAVATARAAATRADTSARSAIRSATWAIVSHGNAVQAAQEANAAAKAAYDSAMEAHGDAEAAAAAAKAAFDRGMYNHQGNITKCMKDFGPGTIGEALEKLYTGQAGQAIEACVRNAIGDPDELAKRAYQNSATCVYLYDEGSQGYDNCIGAVLDPMFEAGQKMALFVAAIQAMTALFTPLAVGALVGCMLTVCGLVAGTLLTIGEVGLNFVNLFNGDQSLGQTILNLGQMALEALLLNGVGKLLSVGFQSIKALYQSKKGADAALTGLTNSNLTRMFGLEIGSCLRPRNLAREAGCWFTYVGNATFVSPGGLSYTTYGDGGQLHRLMHVLDHMQPDPTKTMHSVFVLRPGENVFEMIDSAWVRRADDDAYFIEIQANGRKVWCIPMGRVVGTHGEKHLWITTEEEIIGIPDLVTAFPRLNTDNKCKN
ncbi:ALF repeat-containing protein, partial [Phytohabitans sp. LJ34]|uniref:ALF repeat-containing protein n=1 Tax=Phytohabitans sp. LJ34 TaxID=3452217 RepID=UPI003F8AE597